MSIYIISLIIIFMCGLIKNRKIQTILCGTVLFIIAAFRSTSVGIDLRNYLPSFNIISNTNFSHIHNVDYEYGYVLFNKIIGLIYNDERFFIIITSAFIIFYISKYIYESSEIPWFSFFLFVTLMYFGITFNLLRQSMAMVMTLNCIKFVEKRRLKPVMIYMLIAIFFHKTSIFFFLIYLISKFEINYKYILSLFICGFFIILFKNIIVGFLLNSIESYSLRYNDSISSGSGYGMLILLIGVTILGFIFGKDKSNKEYNLKIYYHMMILAIFSQLIALDFSLFTRVANYFSIGMIIFIPNVIQNIPKKDVRYFGIVCVCMLTTIFYLYSLKIDVNGIVPYLFM